MDYTAAGIALGSIGFCVLGIPCYIMLRELARSLREPVSPLPQYMPLQAVLVPIGSPVEMAYAPKPSAPPSQEDSSDLLK